VGEDVSRVKEKTQGRRRRDNKGKNSFEITPDSCPVGGHGRCKQQERLLFSKNEGKRGEQERACTRQDRAFHYRKIVGPRCSENYYLNRRGGKTDTGKNGA